MAFTLHPQLEKDSLLLGCFPLCQVRLIHNQDYPWILLVPQREAIKEILDLSAEDAAALWREIQQASRVMQQVYSPDKLNVAMLGNMVPQLHVHVIARFQQDAAWPQPVWGKGGAPYAVERLRETASILNNHCSRQPEYASVWQDTALA